jgi:hypothetical protein
MREEELTQWCTATWRCAGMWRCGASHVSRASLGHFALQKRNTYYCYSGMYSVIPCDGSCRRLRPKIGWSCTKYPLNKDQTNSKQAIYINYLT